MEIQATEYLIHAFAYWQGRPEFGLRLRLPKETESQGLDGVLNDFLAQGIAACDQYAAQLGARGYEYLIQSQSVDKYGVPKGDFRKVREGRRTLKWEDA